MLVVNKYASLALCVAIAGCNPGTEKATEAVNATDTHDQREAEAVEAQYANYPEDAAYLLHGGSVDRSIASETLQGKGPNKSLKFFVDYRAQAGWNASEYKKIGRRYCRWNYTHNKITRLLYVYRSENNKEEIAQGQRTEAGPIPGPDDTADNCSNVQNNVIVPLINQITSVAAWSTFLQNDKARVEELLDDPI